jgi:hypothetical protein
VLTLCNSIGNDATPGSMRHPDTLPCAVFPLVVPGAWSARVCGPVDPDLAAAYAQVAGRLEEEGVCAIVADCGYAVSFQKAVRDAIRIPVGLSPLIQLPLLRRMLPVGGRIGVICAYSDRLSEIHLDAAGIQPPYDNIVFGGLEGTETGDNWLQPEYTTDWAVAERDLMHAVERLLMNFPDVSLLLLECTALCQCSPLIRRRFRRPVWDWVTLCRWLLTVAPAELAADPH